MQTDKTAEALREFFNELTAIGKPIAADELTKAKNYVAFGFPSNFETIGDFSAQLEQLIVYGCRIPTTRDYVKNLQAVTADAVLKAAATYIQPQTISRRRGRRSQSDRTGHPCAESRHGPHDVGPGGVRRMSVALELAALMIYSDQERGKWRTWIEADPTRLSIPFQPGGRFPTVGSVLDHIFLVERRHLARMQGGELPEKTGVPQETGTRSWHTPMLSEPIFADISADSPSRPRGSG